MPMKSYDPYAKEHEKDFWTGAECDTDGCENMAGSPWSTDLCRECYEKLQQENRSEMGKLAAKIRDGSLVRERREQAKKVGPTEIDRAETVEKGAAEDGQEKSSPEESSMDPEANHIRRLLDVLDPLAESEKSRYVKLSGIDGNPVPRVDVLTDNAARLITEEFHPNFFPLSQMATDFEGNIYIVDWLYQKKGGA